MAFVPFANCGQFSLCFEQYGQKMENVFHVQAASPMGVVELSGVSLIIADWWAGNLKAAQAANVTATKIIARALDSLTAPSIEWSGIPLGPAIDTGVPLPGNVTFAVKWFTALGGRSYRGRTYHVGLADGYVTGQSLKGTAVAAFTIAYGHLIADLADEDYTLVVASRFSGKAERTTGVATEVIGCTIDGFLDSQRRRLTGRGN